MLNSKWKKIAVLTLSMVALGGCASVAVSDNAIEQRTASALGVDSSSIVVTDRTNDGVKTTYNVKTAAGKTYNCYVTGTVSMIGRVVSDAICKDTTKSTASMGDTVKVAEKPGKKGAKKSAQATQVAEPAPTPTPSAKTTPACNALLSAAGRC